jgi:hypothetical protein
LVRIAWEAGGSASPFGLAWIGTTRARFRQFRCAHLARIAWEAGGSASPFGLAWIGTTRARWNSARSRAASADVESWQPWRECVNDPPGRAWGQTARTGGGRSRHGSHVNRHLTGGTMRRPSSALCALDRAETIGANRVARSVSTAGASLGKRSHDAR